jgi:methylated-DNA-[protein]-cysteine S-methyltransferase
MNDEIVHYYRSPRGLIVIKADEKSVTFVKLTKKKEKDHAITNLESSSNPAHALIKKTCKQLDEYFAGERKEFNLPLSLQGTAFQQKVWKQLQAIPYGKTISYAQLAQSIGNPKACRAVGSANGKNPISVIIPCHRVIAADGSLGGYASGLDVKRQLLELEKSSVTCRP